MKKEELIKLIKGLNKKEIKIVKDTLGVSDSGSASSSKASLDNTKMELEYRKEINEILEKNAAFLGDLTEKNKLRVDILKDELDLELTARRERERSIAENLEGEARKKAIDDANESYAEQIKAIEEIIKYGHSEKLALTDLSAEYAEKIEMLKEESKIKRGSKLIDEAGLTVHKDIAKTLGIKVKVQDTFLGQIGMLGTILSENKDKQDEILAGLKNQVKEAFHYRKIAASVFSAIFDNSMKMFESFDKSQAALAATTGQGQEFNDTLYEVGRQGNLFGVTMEKAGAAIGTLVNETSNFTSLSKSLQANIGLSVAKMEQLGISTADSAKIFQNFNQGLGITASESIEMQKELAMAGVSIGISASKITKDFNASLSSLMVYGRESIDVFKGIAAAAKAAGVETSTLLGIASKFDTFSGAAEGAGKLNALLGTQLSTTEMLMATEDERIRMLVESVQSQGVAFQDMDRFTQKAIANAAGISDMSEANRIFGMSLSAYDENQRKLNASADVQKKFDDAVAKTVPVMEQFKKLGAEIVVALEPFMKILSAGAEYLTKFFKEMDTGTKETIAAIASIVSGLILLGPLLKVGGAILMPLKLLGSAILPSVAATAPAAGSGIATFGATILPVLPILLKFSLIIMGVVGSLALLAASISLIGEAFGNSNMDSKIAASEVKMAKLKAQAADAEARASEFEFKSAQAMASIVTGDHVGALSSIKAMVGEVNKLGQDVKISSTIENLALVTAGKATSITGQRVAASTTNVTANVQNFFEGLQMKLMIDDTTALNAHIASVSQGDKI